MYAYRFAALAFLTAAQSAVAQRPDIDAAVFRMPPAEDKPDVDVPETGT